MNRSRVLIIAAVCAALAAGCGQQQGSGTDEQPETVIVYRDDTGQQGGSASSDDSQDDTQQNTQEATSQETTSQGGGASSSTRLPDDFPLPVPDGYEVQSVRDEGDDIDVDLQVPDGQQAYDEYLQTLRDEGFDIEESGTGADDGQFDGDLDFRNDSFDGDMDFSGTLLEIDLDRLDSSASGSSESGSSDDGGSGASSGSTSSTELPDGFPVSLPGDAEVQSVREDGDDPDDAGDIDVDVNVSDGQAAFDAFLQSLESDGFTIEDSETGTDDGNFDGDIDFYNDEYDGSVGFEGTRAEIDLDSRNR